MFNGGVFDFKTVTYTHTHTNTHTHCNKQNRQKPVVKRYPPISITAWSYFSGAALMGVAALQYVPWTHAWEETHCKKGDCLAMWHLDRMQWIAVAFAVVLNSILKYILITVCNKHATGELRLRSPARLCLQCRFQRRMCMYLAMMHYISLEVPLCFEHHHLVSRRA